MFVSCTDILTYNNTCFFFFFFSLLIFLALLEKHAKEKSKTPARRGAIHQRNHAWFSPTFSGEHYWPSSKRTSARPKRCSSPSHSSWDWNWALLATSSWTRADGVWTNGWMKAVPAQPRPLPALVPKSDFFFFFFSGKEKLGWGRQRSGGEGGCAPDQKKLSKEKKNWVDVRKGAGLLTGKIFFIIIITVIIIIIIIRIIVIRCDWIWHEVSNDFWRK